MKIKNNPAVTHIVPKLTNPLADNAKAIKAYSNFLISVDQEERSYDVVHEDGLNIYVVIGRSEEERTLPLLVLPLELEMPGKKKWIVLDGRAYFNYKEGESSLLTMMRDRVGGTFELHRLALLKLAMGSGLTELKPMLNYAYAMMGRWISSSINNAGLSLDTDTSLKATIAVYAFNKFRADTETTEEDVYVLTANIHKLFGVTAKYAETVVRAVESLVPEDIETMDLETLVSFIIAATDSPSTRDLSVKFLLNSVANSWFGPNRTYNLITAMLNTPTWLAILGTAYTDKSFKRSVLTSIINKFKMRGKEKEFISEYERILNRELV